jgi:hypothetical protein
MLSDFRFALRSFRRSPGLIAAAILATALGVGANTAIFSVLQSTLLRPLPYRDPSRLVMIWQTNPKIEGFLADRLPTSFGIDTRGICGSLSYSSRHSPGLETGEDRTGPTGAGVFDRNRS